MNCRRKISFYSIVVVAGLLILSSGLLIEPLPVSIALATGQGSTSSFTFSYLPLVLRQLPFLLNFDIGAGVPPTDISEIQTGIRYAQSALRDFYDGGIPEDLQRSITVKIVATGLGNQEPGGGGACCTALDDSGARPFFDVLHPHWINPPPYPYDLSLHHQVTASHEYVHAWQWSLGCLTISLQPLGDWLNEGIAHYAGHDPFIRYNILNESDVRVFQFYSALDTGELDVTLQSLESSQGIWPGHIGYLAVERLVSSAPTGLISLRDVCKDVAAGASVANAFQKAFAITKEQFYQSFQSYIDDLINTPCESKTPQLVRPSNESVLDTLKPEFQWMSEINPNATAYYVETATDLNFTQNFHRFGGGTRFTVIENPYDLAPSTTYYWRVRSDCGQSATLYSQVWSFISGPAMVP